MPTPVVAPGAEMPPDGEFRPSNRIAVRTEDTTIERDGVAPLLEGNLRPGGLDLPLNRLLLRLRALLERLLVLRCWRRSGRPSLHDQAAPRDEDSRHEEAQGRYGPQLAEEHRLAHSFRQRSDSR